MTLRHRLHRISDVANKATIAVCAVLLLLMLCISAIGVALEVLASSLSAVGERDLFDGGALAWLYANTRPSVLRLFLPWFGMLSITVAFKYGEHIAILAASKALPDWGRRIAQAVNLFAVAVFAAALVWYGAEFFMGATHLFIVSETIQVSHRWTAASVPVAGFVLCLHLVDGVALLEDRDPGIVFDDELVSATEGGMAWDAGAYASPDAATGRADVPTDKPLEATR
ncbi:TRAP transporter small permease [Stappia stellulata]|uniref:TRAP transporter small permease n=1 Tax=Stappia stellulata TaxID=71235 RepID=UPI00041ECCDF|nr:TRAP transporter small permease subunit [Stappia stellulata]